MKYIFLLTLITAAIPGLASAHDGSNHTDTAWYQDTTSVIIMLSLTLLSVTLARASYYLPRYRHMLAGLSIASLLLGSVGLYQNYATPAPVTDAVAASLTGLPVTVYRTEGCSCCTKFTEELTSTGANVTVETITPSEMRNLKEQRGINPNQESCHTSIIAGYVVEGHVPFAAIAQLVDTTPDTTGITLPGMPIGTPGMPGRQTETFVVETLDNELFWQS